MADYLLGWREFFDRIAVPLLRLLHDRRDRYRYSTRRPNDRTRDLTRPQTAAASSANRIV